MGIDASVKEKVLCKGPGNFCNYRIKTKSNQRLDQCIKIGHKRIKVSRPDQCQMFPTLFQIYCKYYEQRRASAQFQAIQQFQNYWKKQE